MLFIDCAALSRGSFNELAQNGLGCRRRNRPLRYGPDIEAQLFAIREQFPNPEEIDDSPDSTPSKRILALEPHYQKPIIGTLAALETGLVRIRAECPHFDGWVRRLEALA
mgnify:CR=1 FL=1